MTYLCLRNEHVCIHERARAKTTPNEEDVGAEIAFVRVHHVWRDDGDDGIPEPVGRSGEGNAARTNWQREDLTDDNPSSGTPGAGEEEDEDGNESDLGVDSGQVVGDCVLANEMCMIEADCVSDDGHQELANQHAQGTPDEQWATAELLDGVERYGSRADVHQREDEGDQESVRDGACALQEGSGVVEDEVDTGPCKNG